MIPVFTTNGEWCEITGRGWACAVINDRETDDFAHLIGHDVRIDGVLRRVVGVERLAHSAPWRVGEGISLLVKDKP